MNMRATLIHKGILSNSTDFDSNKNSHCLKCYIYIQFMLRYFAKHTMTFMLYIYTYIQSMFYYIYKRKYMKYIFFGYYIENS